MTLDRFAYAAAAGLAAWAAWMWWPVLSSVRRALRAALETRACRCGHGREAHEHYRAGSECALCGCGRWQRRRLTGA